MKALISIDYAEIFNKKTNIDIIPLLHYDKLDKPVSSHADMLFCVLDKTVFCYEEYMKKFGLDVYFTNREYNIVYVSKNCHREYPNDVALNVLIMGNTLFCNKKYVAKEIIDYATAEEYEIINVNQGYSACSTLAVDENNAITSDKGMYNAIKSQNKNVLLIDGNDIVLNGYNCGFIGGATCVLEDRVCFFGDFKSLNDGEKIERFILDCKKTCFSVSSGRVYDFGGIKFI